MRIPKLPITETLLFRKTFRRFSCNRAGCTCSSVLLISVILALRFWLEEKEKYRNLRSITRVQTAVLAPDVWNRE